MSTIPSINSLVEIVLDEERVFRSRMEDSANGVLTIAAPTGVLDPPDLGAAFELAWVDNNSRFVAPALLVGVTDQSRWQVEITGDTRLDNRRMFVRGGGGEQIEILRHGGVDKHPMTGEIIDLSESGVRVWLKRCEYRPGDSATVRFTLKDTTVDTRGKVLYLRRPGRSGQGVDVVVTFALNEMTAKAVRQYIFERELAERRKERKLADG